MCGVSVCCFPSLLALRPILNIFTSKVWKRVDELRVATASRASVLVFLKDITRSPDITDRRNDTVSVEATVYSEEEEGSH